MEDMRNTFRRTPKKRSKLGQIMFYAPIALEVLTLIRNNQKKKRGAFAPTRKRDKALDFLLDQAGRRVGKRKRGLF